MKHQKEAEIIFSQTYGKDSPGLSRLRNNIAGTLLKLKRGKEALDMFALIEKELVRQFGKNHSSIFTVKSNKAMVLAQMEKFIEASRIFKEVENYEQANKLSSVNTRRELLRCLVAAKHLTQAADVYAKLAGKSLDNFDVTLAKNAYAMALLDNKKYSEALKVFQEVERVMEGMKMPPNHTALLNTKQNIATTLQQMGKRDEAGKMFAYVKQMRDMKI